MAILNLKIKGIFYKIEISWRPEGINSKPNWFIRLSYFNSGYKMIISEFENNLIAKNNMREFLKIHSVDDLPQHVDYERAKEVFFKDDVLKTPIPDHVKNPVK